MTDMTPDSSGNLLVENCCNGADIYKHIKQTGVAWPDGVRCWGGDTLVKITCVKCGRELKFERREAQHD